MWTVADFAVRLYFYCHKFQSIPIGLGYMLLLNPLPVIRLLRNRTVRLIVCKSRDLEWCSRAGIWRGMLKAGGRVVLVHHSIGSEVTSNLVKLGRQSVVAKRYLPSQPQHEGLVAALVIRCPVAIFRLPWYRGVRPIVGNQGNISERMELCSCGRQRVWINGAALRLARLVI